MRQVELKSEKKPRKEEREREKIFDDNKSSNRLEIKKKKKNTTNYCFPKRKTDEREIERKKRDSKLFF